MKTYYLDTQMYDYLACEMPELGGRLVKAIRSGKCQVWSSIEILEELAGLYKNGQKFDRVLNAFWGIVQENVLDYASGLFDKELATGAPISLSEGRLSFGTIKDLYKRRHDVDLFSQVSPQIKVNKDRYAEVLAEMGEDADASIADCCKNTGESVRDYHRLAKDLRLDEDMVTDWANHRYPRTKTLNLAELPCVRAMISIIAARMYSRHSGEGAPKDKASDLYDNSHYALAAVAGCLVTRDRRFSNTIDRIEWLPVRVMSEADFAETIRGM